MNTEKSIQNIQLTPDNNKRLAALCGELNYHLHLIERQLGVEINQRGTRFEVIGASQSVAQACDALVSVYDITKNKPYVNRNDILMCLHESHHYTGSDPKKQKDKTHRIKIAQSYIEPRNPNQAHYLQALKNHDINFAIGPSGTGKTFLAVAYAVEMLEQHQVSRIVLTRPAVEAGEKLGYLPGDLTQKIDPYLRPLYDALYEMLGMQKITRLLEKGMIEIAPLAYMRGRTLNDSFVILDEGQNATKEQMQMLLTRIGFGSRAVITGDITQTDLPKQIESGLRHAISLLKTIEAIQFTFFKSNDVVRHPIVQDIIEAYARNEHNDG